MQVVLNIELPTEYAHPEAVFLGALLGLIYYHEQSVLPASDAALLASLRLVFFR